MKMHSVFLKTLFTLVFMTFLTSNSAAKSQPQKVLMVVSGYGQEQGQKAPGYEFDEFSKAYLVFKAHGLEIDIASPTGGPVVADKYDPEKPFNVQVIQDPVAMAKLNNTLATADLQADVYDGVFVVGGKGAMFDLPKDTALQTLIADVYQQEGTIAAVCHGPAALVDVKLSNGEYLLANKRVNGFTNEEEQLFGKKWAAKFEFLLEDKLKERGGKFQSSPIMLSHVAIDGRLITGQNPSSTVAVATEMVKSMGLSLVTMPTYRDDNTMALVAQILAGDPTASKALAKNPEQYQIELVGLYGYYYLNVANNDKQLQNALTLMTLAQKAINNPQLDMQIAKTQHKLGKTEDATATLQTLLASQPDFEPARTLLDSMTQ